MKEQRLESKKGQNYKKITLKDYYENLPHVVQPQTDLINRIAIECGVTVSAVRQWVIYGKKPCKARNCKIISELVGIKEEELW